MNTLVAALFSLALLVQTTSGGQGRVVNLVLPRDLNANEVVWVELKLGVLASGAEVEVETTEGEPVGTVSPHGIRAGNEAGTYTLPVPPNAIINKRLSLRLILKQPDSSKRAPTNKEVNNVRLKITSPVR
jgi:hypothetical protein